MTPKLWTPAPVAIGNAVVFSASEIEAYEHSVLANPTATEHDASRFFQQFPKFLHFGTGAEVRREIVLLGTKQRVDFFRRSFGETYWDVIELKHPNRPLVTAGGTLHPRLSADVENAISQALDYRDLIDADGNVRADLKKKGITVCRPQITVIVGRDRGDIDPETLRKLYDRVRNRGAIDPRSYTDIYNFAKEHYARTKMILVPSLHFTDEPTQFPDSLVEQLVDLIAADPTAAYTLRPRDFEIVIAHVLQSFGYSVELTAASGDGGRDIVATRDGIGRSKILIECKRYAADRKIGVNVLRAMYGTVMSEQATKGMVVTTGTFSSEAARFLQEKKWLLEGVDFNRLVEWIEEYKKRQRGDLI